MRATVNRRMNMNKALIYIIAINGIQIAAAIAALALSLWSGGRAFSGHIEQMLLGAMALAVCWGAALDIREARTACKIGDDADMLEVACSQLEQLNVTMRSQRHDFINHLQVVHSLIELGEEKEATDYIEKVCGDIKRVSRALKTAHPAINALLAAKLSDCEESGVYAEIRVGSTWENLKAPAWEMCRVLGNLIDNAMDAVEGTPNPRLSITLDETNEAYTFLVGNNGPAVPAHLREAIFRSGFSTKSSGRGMGLSIVTEILKEHGGGLTLSSEEGNTAFYGSVPKK